MPTLTQEMFRMFEDIVYQKSDLRFTGHREVFLEARLRDRLAGRGLADFESYYGCLRSEPDELMALVRGLTTNKTGFFRDPAQFAALRERVLPEIVESKNREVVRSWGGRGWRPGPGLRHPAMGIRIWSAGCSTGEEAYSLAFTVQDALKFPGAWDVEILGTDINRDSLAAARRGLYDREKTGGIAPELAGRYMEAAGDGFAVRAEAAGLVKFFESNVKDLSSGRPRGLKLKDQNGAEDTVPASGRFDVIFCRNVMIYFDREAQQRLVNALYDCLTPGGYLFTGDSEPLHLFRHGFVRAGAGEALYYRKPSGGESHA